MKPNYTVYTHTLPNGKMYVGYLNLGGSFVNGRTLEEVMDSGKYHENRTSLFADIQNYGWEQVRTETISGLTKEQAIEKKKKLCAQYQSYLPELGYNRYTDAGLPQPPRIDKTPKGKLAKKLISMFLHGDFTIYDYLLEQLSSYTAEGITALFDKSAITEDVKAEVVWVLTAAFRKYMRANSLNFQVHAVPYVQDNHIEVYLYYCEFQMEYPAYQEKINQIMQMLADPAFRPLTEADLPKTSALVLGYSYDKWVATGQVVPILWTIEDAPHLMVCGPTGGGKTVYLKLLLQQLLAAGALVCVCDYKGHNDLRGFVKNFAAGDDCYDCISRFCAEFEKIREQGGDRKRRVLVVDEFNIARRNTPTSPTLWMIWQRLCGISRTIPM